MYIYLLAFLSGLVLTILITPLVRSLALRWGIVDKPNQDRKIHTQVTPLLGGLALFVSSSILIFIFYILGLADFSQVDLKYLGSILIAGLIIMLGGFLDDKYNLKPYWQIIWPVLAAIIVVLVGVKIGYVTNPLGGVNNAIIYLSPLVGGILAFAWLMGMMYTTKVLDGLDGLVTGMAVIACVMIFLLGLDWDVFMSATGVWALIIAGCGLGFLFFNWHPAKIFLGEGGSIWLGFMLGVLSIISGSKIATTLLVIGIPLLDVIWVVIWRLLKHESPFSHSDSKHLHYQLFKLGLSHKQVVLLFFLIALIFGSLAIFVGTLGKVISLVLLAVIMAILVILSMKKGRGEVI